MTKEAATTRMSARGRAVKALYQLERLVEALDAELIGRASNMIPLPLTMETAPKGGDYIMLFGPSGYISPPLHCEICRYDRKRGLWVNHHNTLFIDAAGEPTGWLPLPGEMVLLPLMP